MRLIKLMLCLAICLSLSFAVFAHSGGTDSSGGHIDNSTGEYHYHHGYPAHQHRDIDGNGILDCPYLFKDKTESSSNKTDSPTDKTEAPKEKRKTAEDYIMVICVAVLLLSLAAGFVEWAADAVKRKRKK